MLKNDMAISVTGLEKSYKNLKVLKGIQFSIKKGSIFALLGSNGAGKTTAIKILTTLIKPDKGSVQICGYDILRQSNEVRGVISLTGQFAAVDEIMTGRENLRMIGKLRHLSEVNNRVDELLKRFDLLEASDRRVATYSGGMRRRLDLAMSLLGKPSVIFLDEPTTGLDPQSRLSMWKIIKDLTQSGITVFLTTQYLDEADQLADHIAILNEGKIVAEGTSAELKKLLPHGHIELKFYNDTGLKAAGELLQEYGCSSDKQNTTLSVATDGSLKQITDILNKLEKQGIPVAEFSQKQATLEDVFLTIIGENKEKEAI
ncbi:MAG: transporter [Eubacterium sp.]|nr:transporter [Eubacterium sp.]